MKASYFQVSISSFHKYNVDSSLLEPGSFGRVNYLVCGSPGPDSRRAQPSSAEKCRPPHTQLPGKSPVCGCVHFRVRLHMCVWWCALRWVSSYLCASWGNVCECVVVSFDMWVSEHVMVSMSVSMSASMSWHIHVYMCACVCLWDACENTRVSLYECGLEWVFEWAWMWVRVSVRSCVFDGVSAAALVGGMEGGDRTLMLRLLDLALN